MYVYIFFKDRKDEKKERRQRGREREKQGCSLALCAVNFSSTQFSTLSNQYINKDLNFKMIKYPELPSKTNIHYFSYFSDSIKHYLTPSKSSANTILESQCSLFTGSLPICYVSIQVNRTCATKISLRKQFPQQVVTIKYMDLPLMSLDLPLPQTVYLIREIPSPSCSNPRGH